MSSSSSREPDRLSARDAHGGAKVDIVLPTYGEPRYLKEAIDSVIGQSLLNWRLVVFDNSPEDGRAATVVEPYMADPRVQRVVTGKLSQAENYTRGLRHGVAPYVALLPDDEYWEQGFLARRVAFLDSHPACGLVFSASRVIDDRGDEIAERTHRLTEGVHVPEDFVPRLFEHQVITTTPVLMRRSACEAVGAYFSGAYGTLIDYEMWLRMAVSFPVGYLAVRDCAGRFHGESVTATSSLLRGQERLRLVAHAEQLIRDNSPPLDVPRRLARRRRARVLVTCALDAAQSGDTPAARGYLRGSVRLHARVVFDPRVWVALGILATGTRGRLALERVRVFQANHHRLRIFYTEAKFRYRDLARR